MSENQSNRGLLLAIGAACLLLAGGFVFMQGAGTMDGQATGVRTISNVQTDVGSKGGGQSGGLDNDNDCDEHPEPPCENKEIGSPKDEDDPDQWPGYVGGHGYGTYGTSGAGSTTVCTPTKHTSQWVQFAGPCWSTCGLPKECSESYCEQWGGGLKLGPLGISGSKSLCKTISVDVVSGACESVCMNVRAKLLAVTYKCVVYAGLSQYSYYKSRGFIKNIRHVKKTIPNLACEGCCPDDEEETEPAALTPLERSADTSTSRSSAADKDDDTYAVVEYITDPDIAPCDIQGSLDSFADEDENPIDPPDDFAFFDEDGELVEILTLDDIEDLSCDGEQP